ncbi:hypothetical protein PM082_012755 [Marasmius tenuissimus]|nr:hypothetical protein PM082_012755 [Marasmius tenuissimus]
MFQEMNATQIIMIGGETLVGVKDEKGAAEMQKIHPRPTLQDDGRCTCATITGDKHLQGPEECRGERVPRDA